MHTIIITPNSPSIVKEFEKKLVLESNIDN